MSDDVLDEAIRDAERVLGRFMVERSTVNALAVAARLRKMILVLRAIRESLGK